MPTRRAADEDDTEDEDESEPVEFTEILALASSGERLRRFGRCLVLY